MDIYLDGDVNAVQDVDRDRLISIFDLYINVVRTIALNYANEKQLATENARLEDNADGVPTDVQRFYLPRELGGRQTPDFVPRHLPDRDGTLAARFVYGSVLRPQLPSDSKAATVP